MTVFFYSCFVGHIGVFLGIFLVPVLVVMLINAVVFVLVVRVLIKHSKSKMGLVKNLRTLVVLFFIMNIFGLHWVFGALTISKASLTFQWLFVIFSTLQGLLLSIYLVIMGADPRTELLDDVNLAQEEGSCYSAFFTIFNKADYSSSTQSYGITVFEADATPSISASSVNPNSSKTVQNVSSMDKEILTDDNKPTDSAQGENRESEVANCSEDICSNRKNGEMAEVSLHVLEQNHPSDEHSLSDQELQLQEDKKLSSNDKTTSEL